MDNDGNWLIHLLKTVLLDLCAEMRPDFFDLFMMNSSADRGIQITIKVFAKQMYWYLLS